MKIIAVIILFSLNCFAELRSVNEVICAPADEAVVGHNGKYSFLVNIVETIDTKTFEGQGDMVLKAYVKKSNRYILDESFSVTREILDKSAHLKNLIFMAENFQLLIEVQQLPMLHDNGTLKLQLRSGKVAPKNLYCREFRPTFDFKW